MNIEQKFALLSVIALNMANEEMDVDEALNDSESLSWSFQTLYSIATNFFNVSGNYVAALIPLISNCNNNNKIEISLLIHPFLEIIINSVDSIIDILTQLLIFLILTDRYDARGRVLMRNLFHSFDISIDVSVSLEYNLNQFLLNNNNILNRLTANKNNKKSQLTRYAKIGLMGISAGAALAVTGGLAAPAIGAALLVMGSTSAAAAVSFTSMATLFGSVGAGLASNFYSKNNFVVYLHCASLQYHFV
jgi:hypothetical protein